MVGTLPLPPPGKFSSQKIEIDSPKYPVIYAGVAIFIIVSSLLAFWAKTLHGTIIILIMRL